MKAGIVRLSKLGLQVSAAHLRYISREGVPRDTLPAYDAFRDDVDIAVFHDRGATARHQFRFIVSPEDACELADLRTFTRHLMARVAGDLGTHLDWVAVDHWDTDNPHTHVVLNGRDGSGKDLVIAGEYIAKGLRARASELATSWLGPRTDSELQASLEREVEADRWTPLDRQLKARIRDAYVDLTVDSRQAGALRHRAHLLGRLGHLQTLGLARCEEGGRWQLRRDVEDTLRCLGERGDIIRTMQRNFAKAERELAIVDPASTHGPVVGRIADKGLADELADTAFVVIDGVDGRAHYVGLPSASALPDLPLGGILDVRPVAPRSVDRNIVAASIDGLYVPRRHQDSLRASGQREAAADIVGGHIRRLEALRRAGLAERIGEGVWRVPADLVSRGLEYDRRVTGGLKLSLRCHLPLERQIQALGATWLDDLLVDPVQDQATNAGFGAEVSQALFRRRRFLAEQGLIRDTEATGPLDRNIISTLRDRDTAATGTALARELGLPYRAIAGNGSAQGVYRRPVQLTSGRFALISDGLGFSLVPWRPVLEGQLGKSVTAVVRGEHVSWTFGRSRSPSIS